MIQRSPFPPGTLVAAYLRDSGGDKQDLSISHQEGAVRDWCAQNGLILSRLYVDVARSARHVKKRTKFLDMIEYFHDPGRPEKAIILWSFSRFARNLNDASMYKGILRRAGYEILSLTDDIPDGPTGKLVEMVNDWANEIWIVKSAIDIRRTKSALFLEYGALGGVPPKGFKRSEPFQVDVHRDGRPHLVTRWVPDPDLWEIVREAWKMRASGMTYEQINNRLHIHKSKNAYTDMFKNRLYIGELTVGKDTIPDYVEPMIDRATWDAVQALNQRMANRGNMNDSSTHPRRAKSSYLLTGLLYCAQCGAPMNGRSLKIKDKGEWHYYRCSNANRTHTCDAKQVPLNTINNTVLTSVVDHILTPSYMTYLAQMDSRRYNENTFAWREEREHLSHQLSGIRQRISNITAAIAETGHSRSLLSTLKDLEADDLTITAQISDLDKKISTPPSKPTDQKIRQLIDNAMEIIDTGDPQAINQLLRGFIEKILVARQGKDVQIEIRYHRPPEDITPPDSAGNSSGGSFPRRKISLVSRAPSQIGSMITSPAGAPDLNTYYVLKIKTRISRKKSQPVSTETPREE